MADAHPRPALEGLYALTLLIGPASVAAQLRALLQAQEGFIGYRGPEGRLIRRFAESFTASPKYDRILKRKPYPPGQHGPTRRVRRSEYALRLFKKQKLKAISNISEGQMRRYMREATRKAGPTGSRLLQMLERRKMKNNPRIQEQVEGRPAGLPPAYLQLVRLNLIAELVRIPEREKIPIKLNEALIVECYARR